MMIRPTDSIQFEYEDNLKIIDEITKTIAFKDRDFTYEPGERRTNFVHVTIPSDAITIQNTTLAEVAWKLVVALPMPGILR